MKKILISAFLIISVCLSLFSCNAGSGNGDEVTTNSSEVNEEEIFLQLVLNGVSEYKICRPSDLPSESGIIKACQDLRKAIGDKTGALLPLIDDWVRSEADIPEYEILVGDVNRPEIDSEPALSSYVLKDSIFTIGIIGKKLVIRGGSDSAVCDGVEYLIREFVNKADTTSGSLRFSKNDEYLYLHDYRIESLTVSGVDISEYSIVLPENYLISDYRTAVYLREHIKTMCGDDLPLIYDNEGDAEYEIRIGKTSRSQEVTLDRHAFAIEVGENSVQLSAESPYAYEGLLEYLTDSLFNPSVKNIAVENGFSYSDDVVDSLKNGTENTMQRLGEYRIMFNNMYGNCDAILHPRVQRQQQLYELYLQYSPDVLGLQEHNEASTVGIFGIDKLLKSAGYAMVQPANVSGNNSTPLYYKADKFNVVDSGFWRYNDGMNDASKSVTWAVFEDKNSGERFCVASTHFWYKSAAEGGEAGRLKDAAQLKEKLAEVEQKYNVPVIVGGDFNCNMSSEAYASVIGGGFTNAADLTKNKDVTRSYHTYPTYDKELKLFVDPIMPTGGIEKSIDHIFIKGEGIKVNAFDVVTDLYALLSTDHCPIYVDIDVEK